MKAEDAIWILNPETAWEARRTIDEYRGCSGERAYKLALKDANKIAVKAIMEQEKRKEKINAGELLHSAGVEIDELRAERNSMRDFMESQGLSESYKRYRLTWKR